MPQICNKFKCIATICNKISNNAGNNQHMGTSSKPREFAIDDLIIPQPQPEEIIRVQVNKYLFYFK